MPYKISWKDQGILWTFYGVVTSKDTRQANLDIYGDPRFGDLRYQIVDISNVDQFDLICEDMDESAALDEAASLNNEHVIVAVVAADDAGLEIARMYQSAMSPACWAVEIFLSMDDAKAWIRSSL